MSNNLSHLPIAVLPLCETHSRIREARRIELIPQKRGRHVASLHPCINLIGRQQEAAQISSTKTRECDRNYVGLMPPSSRHNAAVIPSLSTRTQQILLCMYGGFYMVQIDSSCCETWSRLRRQKHDFFLLQTEPAPSTCVTPQCHTIALLGTTCETSPPRKNFNWLQRHTRHAGPFACSSTPFSADSAEPLDGYESFLAEVRSPLPRVTAINASLQRSTSGNPSSADVKRHPEHDGRPVSPDRGHTHWRHVRNPRALDDTCDGLTRDSHTLVFQSMALFPLFLPGG